MAVPSALATAPTTITIDGNDLHTYGMIVTKVNNPVPKARSSSISINGRDGDFDFSKNYGSRIMSLSGYIIADTHEDLNSYLDSLKGFFRLRENNDSIILIFKDEPTKQWTCKYSGSFTNSHISKWYFGLGVKFSLSLKCVKPYAEKTTETTENIALTTIMHRPITYNGNISTPINFKIKPFKNINLLEVATSGDINQDKTLWDYLGGAVGLDNTEYFLYGASSIEVRVSTTHVAPPLPIYAEIDLTGTIDINKYYVCAFYFLYEDFSNDLTMEAGFINNGASGDILESSEVYFGPYPKVTSVKLFSVKISPDDMVGATEIKFRVGITCSTFSAGERFIIDGCGVYEIDSTAYDDDDFIPALLISGETSPGDPVPLVDPSLSILKYNLLTNGSGDSVEDWIMTKGLSSPTITTPNDLASVTDPLTPDNNCFYVRMDSTNLQTYYSPKIYCTPNKQYKISYKHYAERLDTGRFIIGVKQYTESDNSGIQQGTSFWYGSELEIITVTSYPLQWVTSEKYFTVGSAASYFRLVLSPYDIRADNVIYFKDIMVEESIVVDEDFSSYKKYEEINQNITAELDSDDTLYINNNSLSCTLFDDSSKTLTNAMSNFSGDRLLLNPGKNILKVNDDRINSDTPEHASSGLMSVIATYRERYL